MGLLFLTSIITQAETRKRFPSMHGSLGKSFVSVMLGFIEKGSCWLKKPHTPPLPLETLGVNESEVVDLSFGTEYETRDPRLDALLG